MTSGYEKSPDYGGPPPSPLYIGLSLLAMLLAVGLYVWQMSPVTDHDCQIIDAGDLDAVDRDGRTVSILRLDKIDPEKCVRIVP
jgi:hypothetical protein